MPQDALESLVRRATDADRGEDLSRAREDFHARTGAFAPGDEDYESRIRCFFDWYLCDWRRADGERPCDRLLRDPALSDPERAVAAACGRAMRSLWRVLAVDDGDGATLGDVLGGGRFRVDGAATERLRAGDIFDGRVLVIDRALRLAPGLVFHPAETHEPLGAVAAAVFGASGQRRIEVLDGLLRMRMRLSKFTNMRARHIYRAEALDDRDILSAAWARRDGG